MASWVRALPAARGVAVDILVAPRAARTRLGPVHGDRLKVAVTAPPVDGEANAAVIDAFRRALRIPQSAIEVTAGHTGRRKTLAIIGVAVADVEGVIA